MDIPKDRKMTFIEFVAYQETLDGTIDIGWLEHWKKHIPNMLNEEDSKEHFGDCTKVPAACTLCTIESLLKDYREYFFEKITGVTTNES